MPVFGVWRALFAAGRCVHAGIRSSGESIDARRDGHTSINGVKTISDVTVIESDEGCAAQLSQFFRALQPVRIPVDVTASRSGNAQLRETAVVEFCGREHAIFRSALPLEYNDDVRLRAHESAGQLDARVVAVQYHEGVKAVAVRFQSGPCHWVTTT